MTIDDRAPRSGDLFLVKEGEFGGDWLMWHSTLKVEPRFTRPGELLIYVMPMGHMFNDAEAHGFIDESGQLVTSMIPLELLRRVSKCGQVLQLERKSVRASRVLQYQSQSQVITKTKTEKKKKKS